MCGIAAILATESGPPPSESVMRAMLGMIRHRGPDEFGIYLGEQVALGSARLSIIDLSCGQQPIANEDMSLWIVFNGEIFNYLELREELEGRGHQFRTHSDTEVLLHAYEEYGPDCLPRLNGQFVFAVWNCRDRSLFIARDRVGVRPLFYTFAEGDLIAASEIKAILADRRVSAQIDPVSLGQIFTYWSPLPPRTAFQNIKQLPPGHYLVARSGEVSVHRYWQLEFANPTGQTRGEREYLDEFEQLLIDAVQIRLRADVPVGAYLSGGLDSSTIAAIIRNHTNNHLDTFSIAFTDADYDESVFQAQMARFLGTEHQVVRATHADIGRVFPEVIWHTEVPILRTAPAPMFLLSKLVRDSGYKVVLTGEGADEFLGGYDIFKEAAVRRFWARQPNSKWRPLLLEALYADIPRLSALSNSLWASFFKDGLGDTTSPHYSHAIRWRNTRRIWRFFSDELGDALRDGQALGQELDYPPQFVKWHPLQQAQFLEISVFLSQYLLSSQGDRVGMAHSIEGRFPFLDCRVMEFCNRLPVRLKLRGLTEKYLLKTLSRKWLPAEISQRPKRPYRAPIHRSFFGPVAPDYVLPLLSPESVTEAGLFKPQAVSHLVEKVRRGMPIGETDDMAIAGIISTQLLHQHFVKGFRAAPHVSSKDKVKVCRQPAMAA